MTNSSSAWLPSPDLQGHAGQSLQPSAIFFEPPPPEIGAIVSGYSTLEAGKSPYRLDWYYLYSSLLSSAIFIFLAGIFAFLAVFLLTKSDALSWGSALIAAAIVGWYMLRDDLRKGFKLPAEISYVGENGFAQGGWSSAPSKSMAVLLFQDAAELRTESTRHYVNNAYQHTIYFFTWTDINERRLFTIAGTYRSQKGDPPPSDRYHFAKAAENAWSAFALKRVLAELQRNEKVCFRLRGGDALIVGDGYLEIFQRGESYQVGTKEIGRVSISQGKITLRRVDAKSGFFGIGSSGVFSFNYSDLANARLFLLLFDRLVGVDIE